MSEIATPSTSEPHRDDAVAVLRRLRRAGHVAYFAGGCVRDLLLGQQPKDYDVATDAPPDRVRELFRNTQAVGAAFGVILVRHRQSVIEVATFRTDMDYQDGRRPQAVQFTTPEEDARRRDFTINGLFFDPVKEKVIDYVDGQADLLAKIIRAIGSPNERFAEDHLRLLRAVRFASRFSFEIETVTAAAIRTHAHRLPRISPERIADELRRMLTPSTRDKAWMMLWSLRLVDPIFRFLPTKGQGIIDPSRSIFLAMTEPTPMPFGLVLAATAIDYRWQRADRPDDLRPWLTKLEIRKTLRAMRQGLKISNDETADMQGTLNSVSTLLLAEPQHLIARGGSPGPLRENESGLPPPAITLAMKKRFLATPTASHTRTLLHAIASVGLHAGQIHELAAEFAALDKTDFAPPPFITGDDLTAAGAQPGPAFKIALDAAYDAQLEDRIQTKQQALETAMAIIKPTTNGI